MMTSAQIRMIDFCCGAGGAAVGYFRAAQKLGIDIAILGIDIVPQKNYPFDFICDDVQAWLSVDKLKALGITHIHASPPCQKFSHSTAPFRKKGFEYVDLLTPVQKFLDQQKLQAVTENVMAAPIRGDIILRGPMFELKTIRERRFQLTNWFCLRPGYMATKRNATVNGDLITVAGNGSLKSKSGNVYTVPGETILDKWQGAMGIDWMDRKELAQAIPPAYTEYIGLQWFEPLSKNYKH